MTRGTFRINSCSAGGVRLESDAQSCAEKCSALRGLSNVTKNWRQNWSFRVPLRLGYAGDAVIGRTGKGLRRQQWGALVVAVKTDRDWGAGQLTRHAMLGDRQ